MTVDAKEMPSAMADLLSLVEREIPDGRQSLRDSTTNLEKVADYCEDNYFRSENKRLALEETKNYTTQSLASVAYQINTLAYNLLQMLDLQATQMADMESQINHISQTVAIHTEKVARREIGVLTTNKVNARQHKILVPANPERAVKYIRKPVDFSILDEIGHGVKLQPQQSAVTRSKRGSNGSIVATAAGGGHMMLPPPTAKPPTPPHVRSGMGTLSRSSAASGKEYRVPIVPPPQVPSNYAPNYPIGYRPQDTISRRGSSSGGGYSSSSSALMRQHLQQQQQQQDSPGPAVGQPIGTVHPIPSSSSSTTNVSPSPPPPAATPYFSSNSATGHGLVHTSSSGDCLPLPPPLTLLQQQPQQSSAQPFDRPTVSGSPPLPPPPPSATGSGTTTTTVGGEESGGHADAASNDWIPRNFIEKVIAIYDYGANRYDELSFQENAVIYVVKKNDDGWYEGVLNGITGLFPGNYVEPCL